MRNSTRRLGLIAGLGPEAAVHYYRHLVSTLDAHGEHLDLVMIQADMPRVIAHVQRNERQDLARYFASLIETLRDAGAVVAAIPAVTPHVCFRELEPASPLPLVSILGATALEVQSRAYRKVAVFGTRFTIETALFGSLQDVVQVHRPSDAEIEQIHNIYFRLATTGKAAPDDHRQLTALAKQFVSRDGVDGILLAGTDLAVVFQPDNTEFPYVDCSLAHMARIVEAIRCSA